MAYFRESNSNLAQPLQVDRLYTNTGTSDISHAAHLMINNADNKWSTLTINSLTKSSSGVSSCWLQINGFTEIDMGGTSTLIEKITSTFTELKTWDISSYACVKITVQATNGSTGSAGRGAQADGITFS